MDEMEPLKRLVDGLDLVDYELQQAILALREHEAGDNKADWKVKMFEKELLLSLTKIQWAQRFFSKTLLFTEYGESGNHPSQED